VYSVGRLLRSHSHYSRYLQIFFAHNIITNTKCSEKITVLLFQPNPTHGWTQPMSISVAATETHPVSSSFLYLGRDNISRLDSFFFVYRATLLCILARPSARFAGMQAILYIQFVKQRPPLSRIAPLPCVYLRVSAPLSNTWILGSILVHIQTTSRSVQSFLRCSRL